MKLNIYDTDTEFLVATVNLNDVVSNRFRKLIENWDGVGEYNLDDMIWDHKIQLNFLMFDPDHYSYTLEMTESD